MANTDSTPNNNIHTLQPWDGQDYDLAIFLKNIHKHGKTKGWTTTLYKGYFSSYNKIITSSADLIPTIKADMSAPTSTVGQSADAPLTPARPTQERASYVLSDEDKRAFQVSPQLFAEKLQQIESVILERITDRSVSEDLERRSRGNAIELISLLRERHRAMPMADIVYITELLNDKAATGVGSMVQTANSEENAFSLWKSDFDDHLLCLPPGHTLPEAYVAKLYVQSMTSLDPAILEQIDLEVTITSADTSPSDTATAIRKVLRKRSLRASQDARRAGAGRALAAPQTPQHANRRSDPRKLSAARPPPVSAAGRSTPNNFGSIKRIYISDTTPSLKWHDKRRVCSNFGIIKGCDGKHMDKDCPVAAGRAAIARSNCDSPPTDNSEAILNLLSEPFEPLSPDEHEECSRACLTTRHHTYAEEPRPTVHSPPTDPRLRSPAYYYRQEPPTTTNPLTNLVTAIDEAADYLQYLEDEAVIYTADNDLCAPYDDPEMDFYHYEPEFVTLADSRALLAIDASDADNPTPTPNPRPSSATATGSASCLLDLMSCCSLPNGECESSPPEPGHPPSSPPPSPPAAPSTPPTVPNPTWPPPFELPPPASHPPPRFLCG